MNTKRLVTWDYQAQPPWDEINEAIRDLGSYVQLYEVRTEDDQCAVIISPDTLSPMDVDTAYMAWQLWDGRAQV